MVILKGLVLSSTGRRKHENLQTSVSQVPVVVVNFSLKLGMQSLPRKSHSSLLILILRICMFDENFFPRRSRVQAELNRSYQCTGLINHKVSLNFLTHYSLLNCFCWFASSLLGSITSRCWGKERVLLPKIEPSSLSFTLNLCFGLLLLDINQLQPAFADWILFP